MKPTSKPIFQMLFLALLLCAVTVGSAEASWYNFFYSTSASSAPGGGSITGDASYGGNQSVTCSVTANSGYILTALTQNNVNILNSSHTTAVSGGATTYTYTLINNDTTAPYNNTVVATFAVAVNISTSGTNVTFNPATTTIASGSSTALSVTPATGYNISSVSGCGGSWNGSTNTYTTGAVTGNCTVTASTIIKTSAVTTAGSNVTFSPASATVNYGSNTSFAVVPAAGYNITGVSGCGGTWNSGTGTFTTGAVTSACTVTASTAIQTFTVTSTLAAGYPAGASISPSSKTGVVYNTTTSFTVAPVAGYNVTFSGTNGCGSGTLSGSTYTTGNITGACTVTAAYTQGLNSVTVNQVGGTGTVACCGSGCTNTWLSLGNASYSIIPPNGYVVSAVAVNPGSFSTNLSGPTGATCGGLIFPLNSSNQTLTVTYVHGDSVTKTTYTDGTLDAPANSGGGTISSCNNNGSDVWTDNATATYAITPASGYVLSTISAGPTGGPYNSSVTPPPTGYTCASPFTFNVGVSAQALTAYFATAKTVTPTVQTNGAVSPAGGTITSCNGTNTWGQNTTAYYAMTPAVGYALLGVSVSPAGSSTPLNPGGYSCSGTSYQFGMGTSNQALTANFVLAGNVVISGSTVGGGDIKIGAYNGSSAVPSASVATNSTQTFYFIPPAGKGISSVSYDGSVVTSSVQCPGGDFTSAGTSNATSCTYTVASVGTAGHTLSVNYDTAYQVSVSASTSGCGQTSGGGFIGSSAPGATSQTINVVNGKSVSITFSPNSGFVLNGITLGGSSQLATPQFSAYTYTTPAIHSDATVAGAFTPFYVISTQMLSTPSGSIATGTISPTSASVVCGNNSPPFTITPTPPATITDVSVNTGSGLQSQGVITGYTFTNVRSNSTLQATFTQDVFQLGNYSIVPPFVQAPVLPNLMLMIDNSASQYDLQYDSTGKCYDNLYNDTTTNYYGYFNNAAYYSYNKTTDRFEPLPVGTSMPASCTFRTSFFCVQMGAGVPGSRTMSTVTLSDGSVVDGFIASGKFLNYLATSKLDLQKLILTGGKYDTATTTMVAESRGCMGKRFVKMVSNTQASAGSEDLAGITFVIRGPTTSDPDYVNPAVQNGTTRIDIYDAPYKLGACQAAIDNWTNMDRMGTTQGNTTDCLTGSGVNLKANAYIHMTHVCYFVINGTYNGQNMNTVENDCIQDWQTNWGPLSANSPALIRNDDAGDSVCSSVMPHALINGRDTGYLGLCYNFSTNRWDSTCEDNMVRDFCSQMQQNQVADPSGTLTSQTASTVPSFIIDAGTNALGTAVADYLVKVYQPTPPSGLIQEFKDYIGFGLINFNTDGSGTECNDGTYNTTSPIPCAKACSGSIASANPVSCYLNSDCPSGQSCQLVTKTDGGKVSAYIGDPVGDHTSGLIKVLDDMKATSWTPFAETFYDAMAYYINNTDTSSMDTKPTRIQTGDFDATRPPPSASCYLNNILIITDGASTADQNPHVSSLAGNSTLNPTGAGFAGSCPNYMGSKNVAALASLGYSRNIRDLTQPANHGINNQFITTYVAYSGPNALSTDGCDPYTLMSTTAANGSGGQTPLYYATTYPTMVDQLRRAFKKIATSSASGTAASILNNSQGSGANLLQAVFFPKKVFSYTESDTTHEDVATWLGELQNFWYYLDPYLGNSTVREDTIATSPPTVRDWILDLRADYVLRFGYSQNQATVTRYRDMDGDGKRMVALDTTTLDNVNSIWRAGRMLWERDLGADPRKIYTLVADPPADGSPVTGTLQRFSSVDADGFNSNTTAQRYLQVSGSTTQALHDNTNTLVDYISGIDVPGTTWRSRTVHIPVNGVNVANVWKLGDIVSSTPKLDSNVPLNTYSLAPPTGYGDGSYASFIGSNNYKRRGMTFVGGNDGMLHAFRLGILDVTPQTTGGVIDNFKKAQMRYPYNATADAGSQLGKEEWAYIPMNALPYLKYLGDPNYTHLYYVDNTVTLTDMSIARSSTNNDTFYPGCSAATYDQCQKMTTVDASGNLDMDKTSWRTVLIGGMGLGGATRNAGTTTCTDNVATGTCVKTPVNNIGYSSYFALDVTNPAILPDPSNPAAVKLLWEFNANGELGYSLSGPAIVRIGPANKNGKWFAIFGSGPTGPIETSTHTFYGKSDQYLWLYVVDVATGALVRKIRTEPYAFAGSLNTAVIDTDRNYTDDAVYIGYTQGNSTTAPTAWTNGGVLRLLTKTALHPEGDPDPNNWTVSTLVSGIGPVTTSVAKLQDTKARWGTSGTGAVGKLWLYFGTGRYFYKNDMPSPSDPFKIYGVTDPCYSPNTGSPNYTPLGYTNSFDPACTSSVSLGNLQDQTGDASTAPASTLANDKTGWYVNLASSESRGGNNYNAERVITNPNANTNGTVYFSTLLPSLDPCGVGGNTYIWAFKYDTGATPLTATMKGSILLQVSTGELQQINLETAFSDPTNKAYNLRRLSTAIQGVPPTGSGMVGLNRPAPTKKLLHVQEK